MQRGATKTEATIGRRRLPLHSEHRDWAEFSCVYADALGKEHTQYSRVQLLHATYLLLKFRDDNWSDFKWPSSLRDEPLLIQLDFCLLCMIDTLGMRGKDECGILTVMLKTNAI